MAHDLAREAIDRELASAFVERCAACRTTVLEAVADLGRQSQAVLQRRRASAAWRNDVVEVAVRKHDAAARVIKAYHPRRDTERGAVKQLGAFAVSP